MDFIYQNEPIASQRRDALFLRSVGGQPISAAEFGGINTLTIKLCRDGANYVAPQAGTGLTEVAGSAVKGSFVLQFSLADCATPADLMYEISKDGVIEPKIGFVPIRVSPFLYYGGILAAGAGTIDLDPAFGAAAVDGFYASLANTRMCGVYVADGTGKQQFRMGINYTNANKRVTLDLAFTTPLDPLTSIVRLIPLTSGSAAVDPAAIAAAIKTMIMDPNAEPGAQTFQEQQNIIAAYCGGDGAGLDGPAGHISNLASLAAGVQKNRLEFTCISGKRVYTKRDGT
jgi:hypothetical protein